MKRDNSKSYKVKLIKVDKKVLQDLLKCNLAENRRQFIITKYTGGLCCICRDVPSKMILYDVGDMAQQAKKVERYCTECFKKESKKWVR